jgi:NAD(P)-dependent dehydrogenase (short-subunit alcohol dehydrogenase family)
MEQRFGRVAIVTGGGRGFGRAFALALAGAGMRVAVAARTERQLEETVALIRARGGEAMTVPADVSNTQAVSRMVRAVEDQFGEIDLLVNNAGIARPFGPTWEADPEEWWRSLEVNLKGPLVCSAAVMRGMVKRKRGRIINVASGAGTVSIPYMSAYVTGKTALIRLTEVLADEARSYGISVFAIQPGTVRTAMAEDLIRSDAGQRWMPWFKRIFDEGRDDSFQPGVDLVLYLASGQADALSGRIFAAPGDPGIQVSHADEVRARELYVLRTGSLDKPHG